MSRRKDEFFVELPKAEALDACKNAIAQIGWRIMEESPECITIKEVAIQSTSYNWPAKIGITMESGGSRTKVFLKGSVFGFGPIQSGHLKGQMGRFRNLLEVAAKQPAQGESSPGNAPSSIGKELENLAELHSKGILSDEEFAKAKDKILSAGS